MASLALSRECYCSAYFAYNFDDRVGRSMSSIFFCVYSVGEGGVESVEDERKRRLTLIFGIVGSTLFLLAVLMVGIGLKMSSHPMTTFNSTCK